MTEEKNENFSEKNSTVCKCQRCGYEKNSCMSNERCPHCHAFMFFVTEPWELNFEK